MGQNDDRPAELVQPTRAAPAVAEAAVTPAVTLPYAELQGVLLPTEHVTFQSAPHPIVLVAPVLSFAVIAIVLAVVLAWQTHPIVRGHHVTVPLVSGVARTGVLLAGALLLLREVVSLLRRLVHYLAYRVVTTNRRVFIVEGLFGRRVRPLGNTVLAGATMSQGLLGRMFGFGDVLLSGCMMRTMRDPVRLYHECEAVAMGVEGDTWQQPIRQTLIP